MNFIPVFNEYVGVVREFCSGTLLFSSSVGSRAVLALSAESTFVLL